LGACALLAGFGGHVESRFTLIINFQSSQLQAMLAMVRRQATVYVDGKPVDAIHFSGDSNQTVPLVVGMMKDVELGHTQGSAAPTTATSMLTDTPNFSYSEVAGRMHDHARAEFRYHQLLRIFVVDNKDQATVLRELGDTFRQNHKPCGTPSIESDFCVALERGGLPPGTFSNVNSYGANVVSKLLP
jgi:hypothetical protein